MSTLYYILLYVIKKMYLYTHTKNTYTHCYPVMHRYSPVAFERWTFVHVQHPNGWFPLQKTCQQTTETVGIQIWGMISSMTPWWQQLRSLVPSLLFHLWGNGDQRKPWSLSILNFFFSWEGSPVILEDFNKDLFQHWFLSIRYLGGSTFVEMYPYKAASKETEQKKASKGPRGHWFIRRRYFARLVLYLAISDLWLCTSFLMGRST